MINKLPKSEDGHGMLYRGKNEYCITYDTNKNRFTLWQIIKKDSNLEQYEKISTSNSPTKLQAKINEIEKTI